MYNEGRAPIALERVSITTQDAVATAARSIQPDSVARETMMYRAAASPTMPWWLTRPRRGDMFVEPAPPGSTRRRWSPAKIVYENSGVDAVLKIADVDVPVHTGPIVYRFADPARGEVRRPIAVVPEISVLLQPRSRICARRTSPFDRCCGCDGSFGRHGASRRRRFPFAPEGSAPTRRFVA